MSRCPERPPDRGRTCGKKIWSPDGQLKTFIYHVTRTNTLALACLCSTTPPFWNPGIPHDVMIAQARLVIWKRGFSYGLSRSWRNSNFVVYYDRNCAVFHNFSVRTCSLYIKLYFKLTFRHIAFGKTGQNAMKSPTETSKHAWVNVLVCHCQSVGETWVFVFFSGYQENASDNRILDLVAWRATTFPYFRRTLIYFSRKHVFEINVWNLFQYEYMSTFSKSALNHNLLSLSQITYCHF